MSASPHNEKWAALAVPFEAKEIRSRTQAGRSFGYITARSAMNRLDEVLGPANWSYRSEILVVEEGQKAVTVICKGYLTVSVGGLTKVIEDIGGESHLDRILAYKGAASDALKRCAVHVGVGRHLYGDGIPDYDLGEPDQTPAPQQPKAKRATPAPAAAVPADPPVEKVMPKPLAAAALGKKAGRDSIAKARAWIDRFITSETERLLAIVTADGSCEPPKGWPGLNVFRFLNHFCGWLEGRGTLDDSWKKSSKATKEECLAWVMANHISAFKEELESWRDKLEAEAKEHSPQDLDDGIAIDEAHAEAFDQAMCN